MRTLKPLWGRWLRLAETVGNFQMLLLLSLIYWTLLLIIAIPFKILSDPLKTRKSAQPQWTVREPIKEAMQYMRRQG